MRILFVAMGNALHTARWISQLDGLGWDIHLFDTVDSSICPNLHNVTLHRGWYWPPPNGLKVHYRWPFPHGNALFKRVSPALANIIVPETPRRLSSLIKKLQPDCIHVMNMQRSAYPFFETLPQSIPWIFSSWGSDLYYFRHQPEHNERIRAILKTCTYYIPDCRRDIKIAHELGFEGKILGVFPTGGGYDIQEMQALAEQRPPSQRHIILIKGYQHWVGRAITALEAVAHCENILHGYEIIVYASHPETLQKVDQMRLSIPIKALPRTSPQELWKLMGRARISIGISISDGTPNTLLEAMILGAFPIQTDAGGATAEWITDGLNGLIVSANDPAQIESAIRRAVMDDRLVDSAELINRNRTASLDMSLMRPQIVQLYQQVAGY